MHQNRTCRCKVARATNVMGLMVTCRVLGCTACLLGHGQSGSAPNDRSWEPKRGTRASPEGLTRAKGVTNATGNIDKWSCRHLDWQTIPEHVSRDTRPCHWPSDVHCGRLAGSLRNIPDSNCKVLGFHTSLGLETSIAPLISHSRAARASHASEVSTPFDLDYHRCRPQRCYHLHTSPRQYV
jgi:hypothetical protein